KETLDFVLFFSSIFSFVKPPGTSNYAAGCVFEDSFAHRLGKDWSCAVKVMNWGYWGTIGVVTDPFYRDRMERAGIGSIEPEEGMKALEGLLQSSLDQVTLVKRLKPQTLPVVSPPSTVENFEKEPGPIVSGESFQQVSVKRPYQGITDEALREKSATYLKKILASTLKMPSHQIDSSEPFKSYGMDSILVVQLTDTLSQSFKDISYTLFFEVKTIDELVEYLIETQKETLFGRLGLPDQRVEQDHDSTPPPSSSESLVTSFSSKVNKLEPLQPQILGEENSVAKVSLIKDVAIIGLSGRYAQAKDIDEFWNNLKDGKNCITEIPGERWDWREFFNEERGKEGTTYTKWGGFIDHVDKFDPLFFQIAPKEAERMDPQERLFLETAYSSIEDAGYTPANLCESRRIGVFVGVINSTYDPQANYWSIANRVSYTLNFQGPSMAVDTACSSSLTAIHLALESIYSGMSDCAIAGGVYLIIDPIHHIWLSEKTMLSSTGQCKTFSEQADGFVDGEGVGAIVLKPLSKAIVDRDNIYAVIKGSMLNAGGKTNGYTVPNPHAQFQLISEAFDRAGVDSRTVSYIEAHGTGTVLGDPIEISGLKRAFELHSQDKQFCAIGSLKPNIGHCEGAAGIGGLTKILLQMKYGQLVPSINSKNLNSKIGFSNSPFYVQQKLEKWKRPIITIDNETKEYPRIAGVSSFGAGGANAHLVIEEYVVKAEVEQLKPKGEGPYIILLSARNENRLRECAGKFVEFIAKAEETQQKLNIADLAYTLQIGRESMETRLGFLVVSLEELAEKLNSFLNNQHDVEDLYQGHISLNKETLAVFADEDMTAVIDVWIDKRKYTKLVDLWVKGVKLDWSKIHSEKKPHRISLPTYPFAKERYWLDPQTDNQRFSVSKKYQLGSREYLHPLVHENSSNITGLHFRSSFSGQEVFLADHVIKEQKVLPGVAYLEMARAAVEMINEPQGINKNNKVHSMIRMKNIIWTQPIVVMDRPKEVHIALFVEENNQIKYEIFTESEGLEKERTVHSQGTVIFSIPSKITVLNLPNLTEKIQDISISAEQCYSAFQAMGINYGSGHQGIERLYVEKGQVLAKLFLPPSILKTKDDFVLHPTLLDSALQASIGLLMGTEEDPENDKSPHPSRNGSVQIPYLPFALEEFEVTEKSADSMWAWLRMSKDSKPHYKTLKLDIDICDDEGRVAIKMKGLSFRAIKGDTTSSDSAAASEYSVDVSSPLPQTTTTQIKDKALSFFKSLLSSTLKLPVHRIKAEEPLEKYGIDSVMVLQLTNKLENTFGGLSKTLFFEYRNLLEITEYFLESHEKQLRSILNINETGRVADNTLHKPDLIRNSSHRPRYTSLAKANPVIEALDMAIIGLAGRYPQARNIEEFWNNLRQGKDCISEVPEDRWNWREYYTEDRNQPVAHYSKWGGFIEDMDKFDPLFFNISPREAERMDPQERLFLETVWNALEDAGYAGNVTAQTGVYAGVMYGEYQLWGADISNNSAGIANRVSYTLNLNGPSMTVDTMCSSSLTCIHLACQDLKNGRIDLGIAGGVNISIHPKKYLMLSSGQFISGNGHCESFGVGADGYIPGEGVGAILIKRLADAERDHDHIYGIIKGSYVNHGGKTNGYNVPNPNAQQVAIREAFRESQINPRNVSYMEAHGTGTTLGDPIEITGLTKAFAEETKEKQYCWIGSAKSNIGHCESAAGIAGLTKVLLQMQYGQIVPSLHSKVLNPNIDFSSTPFVVNQELRDWKRPLIDGTIVPRIAGISSFGAGGANAHLVIEEYVAKAEVEQLKPKDEGPYIILLSARNENRLREYADKFVKFIGLQSIEVENQQQTPLQPNLTLEERICSILSGILQVNVEEIALGEDFQDYGVEKIHRIQLLEKLRNELGININSGAFLNGNSITSLVTHLLKSHSPSLKRQGFIAQSENSSYPQEPKGEKTRQEVNIADLAYTLQ
ncbi:MAG: hypothetical protein COB67_13620, partial [SAR324 cluster bacterium]